MKELCYPFDSGYIMKNKKKIKRELLREGSNRIRKKIAVLGGSTTDDILKILEIFLLNEGIEAEFYQSEYNRYREDALFENEKLEEFSPELIFIHTTSRNLPLYNFSMSSDKDRIEEMLKNEYERYEVIWQRLEQKYSCPVIQNNFEMPLYRVLGNRDSWDYHGLTNYISRLNIKFYEYAGEHDNFYINDINYMSAQYGLKEWSAPKYWYMYKYALCPQAIPEFAYNLSNIIKSLYGKNKKALALDLDNTLWGGVIGEDGAEGIEIGPETAEGEAYLAFQSYIKELSQLGIPLTVCSKNDMDNALDGLKQGILKEQDFISIKANWEPKNVNIQQSAEEIGILAESFVLADDNPAERELVKQLGAAAPEIDAPEEYIRILDRSGFFEVTHFSQDDMSRNEMYRENIKRSQFADNFGSYHDYLLGLEMTAEIQGFSDLYIQRITQLINKSNQFNLTTRRYSQNEIESISNDDSYITLYGKLSDKFGDNGIVSVMIGNIRGDELHIELWLMSCRVLKRNMEYAMLDRLVCECVKRHINKIYGYYYKTKKNHMVSGLFKDFGFEKMQSNENEDSIWLLETADYKNKNDVIEILP